ncbi:LPP20 family lipoprotein [Thermodesulfobacteriota bacterium]
MKTNLSILTGTLMILFLVPALATGQSLVEQIGNGSINWSEGFIQAKGIGVPPEDSYGKPQARPLALRAAKLDALRNILEVVKGVRIDSATIVKDFEVQSDIIMSKVEGMVRGARQVKQEYMSDGTVEVVMQVNMQGGFAQLVLPQDIKQVESITPATPAQKSTGVYTGLVVDARGLSARPAMAPKLLDEQGQEIYGSAFVSREYAVQQGMAGYAKNPMTAQSNQRVADNPLTVKGLRTEGPGLSDIVISNSDASRLRNASEHLSFLKKCRVMIVVD